MGTTIQDFLNSEIILFGVENEEAAQKAEEFYKTINNSPFFKTTLENAELIKVVYNTFISTKISMINTVMETCHYLPNTNIDEVSKALSLCTTRIISNKYLQGGMGDGGGCHPRDNIALSYLANKLNLSFNWYDMIMKQREYQTDWLVDLIIKNRNDLNINVLGKSFKPETNLTLGSPSILLKNLIEERGPTVNIWDPYVDGKVEEYVKRYEWNDKPQLFFIGTKHDAFHHFYFYPGSVVIDPFRYLKVKDDVKYIPIGICNQKIE
jgi:UDPglucose 6-dehydrogenase